MVPTLDVPQAMDDKRHVQAGEADRLEAKVQSSHPCPELQIGKYGETIVNGRIVVYTDGAAQNNQNKYDRKAGCGAFWALDHPFNVSEIVQGPEQTNNRAELLAVLRALQLDIRPLDIRSDSKYVVDGATKHLQRWAGTGWKTNRKARSISNADLWKMVHAQLTSRTNDVIFTKVKGHATAQEVRMGTVDILDKWGNDMADSLAVAAAACNPGCPHSRDQQRRIQTATCVQKLMVDIVIHREWQRKQMDTEATLIEIDSETSHEVIDLTGDSQEVDDSDYEWAPD